MTLTTDPDGMSPEVQPYLVLAALADGERVDSDDLRTALADPKARDYLVDLVALRDAFGTVTAMPAVRPHERHSAWTRATWLTAAAAVISLATGYIAGQRTAAQTLATPTIETSVDLGSPPVAPQPTVVVSLRPGVNWTETTGGQ
jgi:hypothetical protein